jgi:hypothetical protein
LLVSLLLNLIHSGIIERTIYWKAKGWQDHSARAFDRAIELLDLTIADEGNRAGLRELLRVREALADFFVVDNVCQSTTESWQHYFRCPRKLLARF